jgi:pyruvate/2-oxoglutarate dehydrogenase complex dihydrolipoamide acyltransferase (E2) component
MAHPARPRRHVHSPRVRRLAAEHGIVLTGLVGTGPNGRVTPADVLGSASSPAGSRPPRHVHSPRVRRLAREHGVDLAAVQGSGPAGRVTPGDVLGAVPAPAPVPAQAPLPGAAAQPAASAVPTSLSYAASASAEVVAGRLLARAAGLGANVPQSLGVTLVVAHALLESLRRQGAVEQAAGAHLLLDVDGEQALLAAADELSLDGLLRRASVPAPQDTTRATLCVSHVSVPGVAQVVPPLAGEQVLALSAGPVADRPVVVTTADGEQCLAVRATVHLSLTYDARRLDPPSAARLLADVAARLSS